MKPYPLAPKGVEVPVSAHQRMMRKLQPLYTTVSWQTAQRLQERADYEGPSLSSLMAFVLDSACSG